MKRLAVFLLLLWPTLAYPGDWQVQVGPVLPWKRDHQQTTSYRSWAGSVSYQWEFTPWLKGGLASDGMLFRFPDTSAGYVIGVGPVLTPRWQIAEGWWLEAPFGAEISWNNIESRCIEISTSMNALLHAGVAVRYKDFSAEIRWQHISNAGTKGPNVGMDWVIPMVGWRF
jgi:hypothetical protein